MVMSVLKEYGHGEHFQHTSADPVLRSRCFINQFHPPNGQLSTVDPLDHCPDFFCSDKCGSTEHTLVPRPPCLAGGKGDCRACCRPLFCNCWCFTNTTNTNLTGTQVLELGPQDQSLLWSGLVSASAGSAHQQDRCISRIAASAGSASLLLLLSLSSLSLSFFFSENLTCTLTY